MLPLPVAVQPLYQALQRLCTAHHCNSTSLIAPWTFCQSYLMPTLIIAHAAYPNKQQKIAAEPQHCLSMHSLLPGCGSSCQQLMLATSWCIGARHCTRGKNTRNAELQYMRHVK